MRCILPLVSALVLIVLVHETSRGQASLYDCEDFASRQAAQDWFDSQGFDRIDDPYNLDGDDDGEVCEWGVDRQFYYDGEVSRPAATREMEVPYTREDYLEDQRKAWESNICNTPDGAYHDKCDELSQNTKELLNKVGGWAIMGFIGLAILGCILSLYEKITGKEL